MDVEDRNSEERSPQSLASGQSPLRRAYAELELGAAILDCLAFTLAYRREAATQESRLEGSDFALVASEVSDLLHRAMNRIDAAKDVKASEREVLC